jgi:hypothetical protein
MVTGTLHLFAVDGTMGETSLARQRARSFASMRTIPGRRERTSEGFRPALPRAHRYYRHYGFIIREKQV